MYEHIVAKYGYYTLKTVARILVTDRRTDGQTDRRTDEQTDIVRGRGKDTTSIYKRDRRLRELVSPGCQPWHPTANYK